MNDWEQAIVHAENAAAWLIAPWYALWRLWRSS